MIILQQAFYGRSQTGYRLLASSCMEFNERIEQLCAAVGTPDGSSVIEPFFINYIEGNHRFMIQCCIGNPDDAGRKTLFFHVFIGDHSQLKNARMGIASLIRNKFFETKLPIGPIMQVSIEEDAYSLPWGSTSLMWHREKLAIVSRKPELNLLTGILKNNIDNVSWASFAFQPLDMLDIYVLSEYVSRPNDRKCVMTDGTVDNVPQKPQVFNPLLRTPTGSHKKSSGARYITLILLLFLFFIFGYWLGSSRTKDDVSMISTENPIKQAVPSDYSHDKVTREEVMQELRKKFDHQYRINGNWDEAIKWDPVLERQYSVHKKKLLIKAKGYVEFVNKEILDKTDGQ